MQFSEVVQYLDRVLSVRDWEGKDKALNGLQVARKNQDVSQIAFAVDASMLAFERAVAEKAELLVVHHGLFWGYPQGLTGAHYERVKFLMEHDLALYAAHLPLDAHAEVGNNAGMAQALALKDLVPFGSYRGVKIGFKGKLAAPRSLESICEVLFHGRENALQILPFGKKLVQTVGIVSGGASQEVSDAIAEGLDLYITGDADHVVYHQALEAGINVIFGGHYATETWGVRLLAQKLKADIGLPTYFLDLPTGL